MSPEAELSAPQNISITPLLRRLWPSPGAANVTAEEIALAISHIFTDQLSPVQTGALLTCLHFTGWDRRADVIAKCAEAMREAASQIDREALEKVVKARGRPEGDYHGGLVSCTRNSRWGFVAHQLCSAILLELGATRTRPSTSLPRHLF
jgi:anthranilate phosphoribosyltransferase